MIAEKNGVFFIETENTSYVFSVQETGYAEHIYYGRKLRNIEESLSAIREKHLKAPKMSTLASSQFSEYTLNDSLLEFSFESRGDYKTPLVALSWGERGDRSINFVYSSHSISSGIVRFKGPKMPQAIATEEEAETLKVEYEDKSRSIKLITYYTAFYHRDVITRRVEIVNNSNVPLKVRSLYSLQLDLRATKTKVTSFSGPWGREKVERTRELDEGGFFVESRAIMSGEADSTVIVEDGSNTYAVGLLYSGAFRTSLYQTTEGITHITTGINPALFSWKLESKEAFESPEAILTYSENGKEGVGIRLRKFTEEHIRRGKWKNRMKPLVLNTWDSLGFDPDESDVLKMAKEAKSLGLEAICIDDGWFGSRDDNTTSLGDWYADTRHFPSGIKDLANEVHYLGLMFGLWFEMEGLSERSMLYKTHPDWVIGRNNADCAIGNNQQLLDITRTDVQEWVIATLSRIIESANIDYIRWSISRFQGDMWSNVGKDNIDSFAHRYVLGLYHILDTITKSYPNLYIEMTSRGAMRFDYGMLSYASSILSTECSDCLMSQKTIESEALIYPLSVMSRVLSSNPDKYTSRSIEGETKFNSSIFGVLEYSINPLELSKIDSFILKQQIDFYKAYRPLLQYGTFKKVEDNEEKTIWSVSNGDSSVIILLYYLKKSNINTSAEKLYVECANENYDYSFMARNHLQNKIDLVLKPQEIECYNASGDALKWAGISLSDNISGNGWEDGMRTLQDNNSRLYIIKRKEENK